MEVFLEYTETAFCLQFIFYEVEGLCQDKCRHSSPLAMGDSSTSLRSAAAEAVVSSSARPRGRNLTGDFDNSAFLFCLAHFP